MTKEQMLQMQMMIKRKLLAATAMLLVSAMMLSTSTYAWVVLSIAPEVSSVKTTAGSNGNLEIALLGTGLTTGGTNIMSHPTGGGVGESTAIEGVPNTVANQYYGNIVDLSEGYGLDDIMLTPARLNLIQTGNNVMVNPQNPLTVPKYGTDGRISSLENPSRTHYDPDEDNYMDTPNWGVNIIGFPEELNSTESQTVIRSVSRESIRAEAAEYVYQYRYQIREKLIDMLEAESDAIFGVLNKATKIRLKNSTHNWDNQDAECIRRIANALSQTAAESDAALRWAFLAYCVSDNVNFDAENEEHMAELGNIYKQFLMMPLIPSDNDNSSFNIKSIAENNKYYDLVAAIEAIQEVKKRVAAANNYLATGDPLQVGNAGALIIDVTHSYIMNGVDSTQPSLILELDGNANVVTPARSGYYYNLQKKITKDKFLFIASNSVGTDGLFQAIARVVGDYTAVLESSFEFSKMIPMNTYTYDLLVTSKSSAVPRLDLYNEDTNTGTLGMIYDKVAALETSGMIPLEINRFDVNAYGYQVDLAFRSSQAGSLVLEREGLDRVLGMTKEEAEEMGRTNVELQGNGSTFSFKLPIDMLNDEENDYSRVNALLSCIHIVFMATDGQIYAVGVPGNASVKGDIATGEIRLYNVNQAQTIANDGVLSLGSEITNSTITTIQKDIELDISVVVYLDGDKVSGAYTSASKGVSLDGSLNLQFGNTAELKPMDYSGYLPVDSVKEGMVDE